MIRYAKLLLPFDLKSLQTELLSISNEWQPHINTYHYTGSWQVLSLRSPGGSHTNTIPDLMGETDYMNTLYMDQFPSVKKLLATINCPVMAVRFLNLQAGAIIKQHTDAGLAFEKGEARLHFPVFTNPGVEFYCEDDRIALQEGDCWYLNANLPHRVTNNGDTDRIHLVIDCNVNDWLTEMVSLSPDIAHKDNGRAAELVKIIEQLRYQNTEAGNRFADQLQQELNLLSANAQ